MSRRTGVKRPLREGRRAQALIEIFFVTVLFMFVGMMGYEGGVMYHNVDVVHNALKQAAWVASMGAQDPDIEPIIADCDTQLLSSVFFDHLVSDFKIEVFVPTPDGLQLYAPTSSDKFLTGGETDPATGQYTRAAYVWRAFNMNIRLGLTYKFGYVSPYFGATPVSILSIPLSASQPITARNDEDRDGMVDIYEPEIFNGMFMMSWAAENHTDSTLYGAALKSDKVNLDIDGDQLLDTSEVGFGMYDYDNDGHLDNIDIGQNLMRNPILGGGKPKLVMPTS